MTLHTYFRSSAAYRVRIALGLKGVEAEMAPVHLLKDGGEQHGAAYGALNPQHLVPLLEDDGMVLARDSPGQPGPKRWSAHRGTRKTRQPPATRSAVRHRLDRAEERHHGRITAMSEMLSSAYLCRPSGELSAIVSTGSTVMAG